MYATDKQLITHITNVRYYAAVLCAAIRILPVRLSVRLSVCRAAEPNRKGIVTKTTRYAKSFSLYCLYNFT